MALWPESVIPVDKVEIDEATRTVHVPYDSEFVKVIIPSEQVTDFSLRKTSVNLS